MRKQLFIWLLWLMIPLLSACQYTAAENTNLSGKKGHGLPAADPLRIWIYMSEANHNEGWGVWPGYNKMVPGKSPQGSYVRIYANALALNAIRASNPMPYGAVLVKESYGDNKELKFIMPMYKIKGYNPRGGDWFWAKYHPNGRILASGKVRDCINCHGGRKGNDWLFSKWRIED